MLNKTYGLKLVKLNNSTGSERVNLYQGQLYFVFNYWHWGGGPDILGMHCNMYTNWPANSVISQPRLARGRFGFMIVVFYK